MDQNEDKLKLEVEFHQMVNIY